MGDSGDKLAKAGELLGLDHPALGRLECFVCLSLGLGQVLEHDVLLFQQLFSAHPLGHVPEDPLDSDGLSIRTEEGCFHDLDVELLALGSDVLFDNVDELTALEHVLVVLAILFGELSREEIEICLALDFLESAAKLGAELSGWQT